MARCNSCNGIITRTDLECYICGEPVPERAKFSLLRFWARPAGLAAKRAAMRVTMRDALLQQMVSARRTQT